MVEHTDTDNYHIHFIIPRLELTSGKAFNPHYYKQDQTRLLKVQEYLNAKHGLSSAFSEEKRELLRINTKKKNSQIKKEIHKVVLENIKSGHIQNRDELLQFFQDSGATIPRKGKDYITVQFGKEKHRLKGEIYGETFKSIDAVTETIGAAEREHKPTTQAEFGELEQEVDRLIQYKAKTNRAKYPKREQDYAKKYRLRIRGAKTEQDSQVHRDNTNEPSNWDSEWLSNIRELGSTTRNESNGRNGRALDKEQQIPIRQRYEYGLDKGKLNDRARENIKRRIERSRAERKELDARLRKQVSQIHSEFTESNKVLREKFKRDSEELRNSTKPKLEHLFNEIGADERRLYEANARLIRSNRENIKYRSLIRREREKLSRAIESLTKTSLEYQREFERVKRNIVKLNEITQKFPLNYQQKIFVNHYKNLSLNTDFKSFYIKDNIDNFQVQSKKLGINIKDYGDKITATNTKNSELQVKLMLDIAESKGWNLTQLNVKGSDNFKKITQLEIEKRVELQGQQAEEEIQQSRSYSRGLRL